jgi:hypothetical protein
MPNPSYQKGYRFEKKVQAWLVQLGKCTRSMMSRGADLTLLWSLREWKVSCKSREKSICKLIDSELETSDLMIFGCDRGIPIVAMHLPKFIEFCRELSPSQATWEGDADHLSPSQYLPNGTEG